MRTDVVTVMAVIVDDCGRPSTVTTFCE